MTQYLVNPLGLFYLVWGTATALYAGGVWVEMFPRPQLLTIEALLLNVGTFSLGYFTWSLFEDLPSRPATAGLLSANPGLGEPAALMGLKPLTRRRLTRLLQVLLLLGLATLLMEFYRLSVVAGRFNTSWWYLITHPSVLRLRLTIFIAGGVFETNSLVMAMSLANGIFSVGFILLGLFLYLDRTWWRYFYLSAFLLISLAVGLLHLTRCEATVNILFLVFAYCFMSAQDRWNCTVSRVRPGRLPASFTLVLPLAVIGVLFLIIDLLLQKSAEYGHANRLQGFAFHFWWYLSAPLAAFNEFLTTFKGHFGLGQNTFLPFYKWLCRLHLAPEIEVSLYEDKVLVPYMANVYTYLRNFYEDFGLWGVALAPYLLGGTLAAVRRRARRSLPFLNLYLILLLIVFFSFYNFYLFSNQVYLQILFGFLLFRYRLPHELTD